MSIISSQRRVLSKEQAIEVGKKLLGLVREDVVGVHIEHTSRAVAKVVNGRLRSTDDGDRARISFKTSFGSGISGDMETNQLNEASLQRIVEYAKAIAPEPAPGEIEPVDANDAENFTYNPRSHLPVKLWYDSTASSMSTARGEVIPQIIDRLRTSKLNGAATVGLAQRSVLHLYRYGLTAFAEETDSEITVTARTPDNTGSGWAGQGSRDWNVINPASVTERAIEMARRSQNPVAVEPGRRTAILSPAAVAQLVRKMSGCFAQNTAYRRGAIWSPFTNLNAKPGERQTLLGKRVLDRKIVMISDPADPLGGFPPFYESGGLENFGVRGYPNPPMTWIDKGILVNFANNVPDAMNRGVTPCDVPRSVRLMAAPGEKTATIDEMIANCQDGIYVNSFSDVEPLRDAQEAENNVMLTGVTRNGCFLVRNGKIEKPIKNFRFLDSPFFVFNRVEMIGVPERVAFGYNSRPTENEDFVRWPRFPTIVPPMVIRDFNFSRLADAI